MDHHEKLAWSSQHLHALDLEIQDFIQKHPFTARCEQEGDTRRFHVIADDYPLLPPHWPLMMGDAIHNIRSALDHLIWALTDKAVARGGTAPNDREALKVGYPICLHPAAYLGVGDQKGNGQRKRMAGWIGDAALAVVDGTQPYRLGKDAHEHPLAVLASYSNEDKHRNLMASAALADSIRFRFSVGERLTRQWRLGGFAFSQPEVPWFNRGADFGLIELNEGTTCAPGEMRVEPIITGTIAFRQKGPAPAIAVAPLEKVSESILREIVAPLDDILMR